MPDWSYHILFKPILHKIKPVWGREFIHRGMSTVLSLPFGSSYIEFLGHMSTSKQLSKNLFGVNFPSQVGLSGKIDPQLSGTNAFLHLGFGFVEVGPITVYGRNDSNLSLDSKSETITMPDFSINVKEAKKKLKSLRTRKVPLLINLDGTDQEILFLVNELVEFGDAFVVKQSSLHFIDSLKNIKKGLLDKPLILSLPAKDYKNFDGLDNYLINGILLEELQETQTIEQNKLLIEGIQWIRAKSNIPIITVGGIKEPTDAISLLQEGASLVLLGFNYVFSGPGLPKRINEAKLATFPKEDLVLDGWVWYWLFGLCITIGGLIALLFSMTRVILPYDEIFLGILRRNILDFNPSILYFMAHDRMTLSGTMMSGGFIYMQLARHGIKHGLHWARRAVNIGGIIGFLGILSFLAYGYFDWLHGLFWLILLPLFITGYVKTTQATRSPSGVNLHNHINWKRGLLGQLAFVILGFSLLIGGIVITVVGVTTVFVPTDLSYICLTPEAMNEFNDKLIPVIAHDRAGFGSALFSVGLLVLMLSLWGYRENEHWVWWTLTIGAIPAFLAGITTHFVIGYTDFTHLLPAYFALFLYFIGVLYSAPYLLNKKEAVRRTKIKK